MRSQGDSGADCEANQEIFFTIIEEVVDAVAIADLSLTRLITVSVPLSLVPSMVTTFVITLPTTPTPPTVPCSTGSSPRASTSRRSPPPFRTRPSMILSQLAQATSTTSPHQALTFLSVYRLVHFLELEPLKILALRALKHGRLSAKKVLDKLLGEAARCFEDIGSVEFEFARRNWAGFKEQVRKRELLSAMGDGILLKLAMELGSDQGDLISFYELE